MCKQLAQHYDTIWCPEFAREYLLTNGMDYTYDDLLNIAKGQLALEDEFVQSLINSHESATGILLEDSDGLRFTAHGSRLLFIDTDMYVMKVWCEFVFGKCHRFILDRIVERKYDLYLLCNIDLPWIEEPLREYPDLEPRQQLYKMYKDILINQPVPWTEISGTNEVRLSTAIEAVDKLLRAG